MTWRLAVLGGASLTGSAGAIAGEAGQRRNLALLAVLAAHGELGIPRARLQALLWPESDEGAAGKRLKQAIYVLRRELGSDAVVGTADLRLDSAVISCDVVEFDAALAAGSLEVAVGLRRGPFLDGFHPGGDAEELERWIDAHRDRTERAFRQALEQLAARAEETGDQLRAIHWWQRLVEVDPLSGRYARALVHALLQVGDRAGAVRHIESHRALLAQELGLPPDAALERLVERIRTERVATAAPSQAIALPARSPVDAATRAVVAAAVARRRRVWPAIAAALVVVAVTAFEVTRPPNADLAVVVAAENTRAVGAPDSLTATRLTSTLHARFPEMRVFARRGARRGARRARFRVEVRSWVNRDTVWFDAVVTDASVGAPITPGTAEVAVGAGQEAAIARLADRVSVEIASRRFEEFRHWAYAARLPHSWEAFTRLREGIRAYVRGEHTVADGHFAAAESADSVSAIPLIWRLQASGNARGRTDSTLRVIERRGLPMGEWERAFLEFHRLVDANDLPRAHSAGHELLRTVPGSEWTFAVAHVLVDLGRYSEALALHDGVPYDRGFARGWRQPWITADIALHLAERYAEELALVHRGRTTAPDDHLLLQMEVKALAGLGLPDEVVARCERSLTLRGAPSAFAQPCDQAIVELATHHGLKRTARELTDRFLRSWAQDSAITITEALIKRAERYSNFSWEGTDSVLALVPDVARADPRYHELQSWTRAVRGDRAGVTESLGRLGASALARGDDSRPDLMDRAAVAALLGDRDEAVSLIQQALQGERIRHVLHWYAPYRGLRGYPPFDDLLRPVEDPAHVEEYVTRRRRASNRAR